MANIYVDVISGNDTTGDGTASLPYLTIEKAMAVGVEGVDEIRMAKTPDPTQVSATFTFTCNSKTITANADVTGDFAVGDYIAAPDFIGNGTNAYFMQRITAISYVAPTTTITTDINFYNGKDTYNTPAAATEITSYAKKINYTVIGSAGSVGMTITKDIPIVGGYTLATETRDSATYVTSNNAYNSSSGQFFQLSDHLTMSYVNIVNEYQLTVTAAYKRMDLNNCSIYLYYRLSNTLRSSFEWNNVSLGSYANYAYFTLVQSGYNYVFNNCNLNVYNKSFHGDTNFTFSNCKLFDFAGVFTQGSMNQSTRNFDFTGSELWYCNYGIREANQLYLENLDFYLCNQCIRTRGGQGSVYINNCNFYGCSYGIYSNQTSGHTISNCTFDGCSYGFYQYDQYQYGANVVNCDFKNIVNYGIYPHVSSGGVKVINCTCDNTGLSSYKFIRRVTSSIQNMVPYYSTQGIDQYYYPDGTYYGKFDMVNDNIVHSSYPSVKVQNKSTQSRLKAPVPIATTYVSAGVGKTFKIYIKANVGWTGDIDFKFTLNGDIIKELTTVTETEMTTDWVEYTFNVAATDIPYKGALELCIVNNANTIPWYYDDVRVSNYS